MNRRCFLGIASVLYFICFVAFCGQTAYAFELIELEHSVKIVSDAVAVISGYTASFFYCLTLSEKRANAFMRAVIFLLFVFYIIMLVDFTLIDDNFGRNIFNFLSWDKGAFAKYINTSTNFIPFATVKLFIKGYVSDYLSLWDTVVNLLGNFLVFMPFTFFTAIFFKKPRAYAKMLVTVLIATVVIELLQLLFLTGATDIDDLILNTSGAMLCYYILHRKRISKVIRGLTFGVWNDEEQQI